MTNRLPEDIDREAQALRLRLRELRAEKRFTVLRAERKSLKRASAAPEAVPVDGGRGNDGR